MFKTHNNSKSYNLSL